MENRNILFYCYPKLNQLEIFQSIVCQDITLFLPPTPDGSDH